MIMEKINLTEMIAEQGKNNIELSRLWEHKKEFLELPEEEIRENPILAICIANILFMEGRLKESERYVEYVHRAPVLYDYIRLMTPYLDRNEFRRIVEKQLRTAEDRISNRVLQKADREMPRLILTAGRPSLLNGFRDFTDFGPYMKRFKEPVVAAIRTLYGEAATGVYEIALAEHLYWKNECFEALVLVVGTIPFMEHMKDVRCLFAALTLEIFILVANGQVASAEALMTNMGQRLVQYGSEELEHNLRALEVWAAMYDGNTERINQWMKEDAPDEFGDFNMLDTFRYMIKLRGYLIQEKHMALFALAERMRPLLEAGRRRMDLCEMTLIQAMSLHAQGRKQQAFDLLEKTLRLCQRYGFDRLVGDEGGRMYRLLYDYRRERGSSPYLNRIMEIARKVGLLYPNYLKVSYEKIEKLTRMEFDVLRLMAEEKGNGEISEYLDISLNTVKFHSKNIFKKLSVDSRGQAVKKAKENHLFR